jgi:hypothetical protein
VTATADGFSSGDARELRDNTGDSGESVEAQREGLGAA